MKALKSYISKLKSGSVILIDQGIVSGTSFLIGILLTRLLGLSQYGQFVLLWMIVLFGLSIAQALITKPMVSIGPKLENAELKKYLSSVHGVQLSISILAVLLTIIGLTIVSQFQYFSLISLQLIIAVSLTVGLALLFDFYRKSFFLKDELRTALFTDSILAISQLSGLYFLHKFDILNLTHFFAVISFGYFLSCMVGFVRTHLPDLRKESIDWILQKHFNFSKWLLATVIMQWFSGNFFILAAGGIIGVATVGAVRIAQNVIGLTHVIFLAMENILPVHAAKAFNTGGHKMLFQYLKNKSIQIGWAVLAILLTLAIFAPNILSLIYGAEYSSYAYILIGFCIIYLCVYVGYPLRFALRTIETTRPIFTAYALTAIFSLFAAAPMLKEWGIYGLLAGLLLAQLICQTVYIISLLKIKKSYENHSFDTGQS